MEFGVLARLIGYLGDHEVRRTILRGLTPYKPQYSQRWLESTVRLRNACAHQSRLTFYKMPATTHLLRADAPYASQMLFPAVIACARLYAAGWNDAHHLNFVASLADLFARYPDISPAWLGFPANWRDVLTTHPPALASPSPPSPPHPMR